jgi:hypothetical protein
MGHRLGSGSLQIGRRVPEVDDVQQIFVVTFQFLKDFDSTASPDPALEEGQLNDIVIFGVGHSGTSLLARMIHTLGWYPNDADATFAENVRMREINRQLVTGDPKHEPAAGALEFARSLSRPFAIKDPRLVETLSRWTEVFAELGLAPMLLMIDRDRDDLVRSYTDRNEFVRGQPGTRNRTLDELLDLAEANYFRWPYPKMRIRYEKLVAAALLVRTTRTMRKAGGLWLNES